jgi:RNA polymerase sigma factor (sigma-70 family)
MRMKRVRALESPRAGPAAERSASLSLVGARRIWTVMPSGGELIELMRAVADAKDRGAFAVLFKHLAPRIKAYLIRSGTVNELAEELAQETMVTVWRKASSFDPARAQVSTWVFTIARNLRIDALRRQPDGATDGAAGDGDADADPLAWAIDQAPPLDEQMDGARREVAVRHALAQLSAEQLQVVWLSFYDEQSHARIASELDVPLGTVKSRIRLAMSRLSRLLQGVEA